MRDNYSKKAITISQWMGDKIHDFRGIRSKQVSGY